MERWAQAEDVLSDDEVSLMEAIVDPKDRGPILFWLTNERSLPPGPAAPLSPVPFVPLRSSRMRHRNQCTCSE